MIKEVRDLKSRPSGVIYESTWEQIKKLYNKNPDLGKELAFSVIEQTLTGDISSDDLTIQLICDGLKPINQKAQQKYDIQVKSKRESKCESLQLQKIVELVNMGKTQEEIGKILGVSRQTINNRIRIINEEFPELKIQINVKKSSHVKHNVDVDVDDNVDDNDNVDVDDNGFYSPVLYSCENSRVISLSESVNKAAPAAGAANKKKVVGDINYLDF